MRILAITLNWRQPQLTLECVQALRSLHTHVDILVIDNGSGDNSAEILAAGLAPAELVCLPNNVGFAAGSNHGLRYAIEQGYTYALLLNNDAFPSADMLDQLLAETSDDTALLTPVIYYEAQPNRIWYGGARRHKHTLNLRDRLQNQIDSGQITTHDVDYVLGTCVFVNLAAVAKVGLLDERYFMYFEDLDWSPRFQSAGYRVRLVAPAKLYHRVAVSTGGVESPLRRFYLCTQQCDILPCTSLRRDNLDHRLVSYWQCHEDTRQIGLASSMGSGARIRAWAAQRVDRVTPTGVGDFC